MISCAIRQQGGFTEVTADDGVASVIDCGKGEYTVVFERNLPSNEYVTSLTTTSDAIAYEREDWKRTKSDFHFATTKDTGVNVVIHE